MYRSLGDLVATSEARDLAEQLVRWHDAMVMHLRSVKRRGVTCNGGYAHDQAHLLWIQALAVFGEAAARLTFLRTHGERRLSPVVRLRAEVRV